MEKEILDEEFTEQDLVDYIKEERLDRKLRKREIIDPRNYIINILYYKFKWSELRISIVLDKNRSSISLAKNSAFFLAADPAFLRNTIEVREKFPWTPQEPDKLAQTFKKRRSLVVFLDDQEVEKVENVRKQLGVRTLGTAIKYLIKNLEEY